MNKDDLELYMYYKFSLFSKIIFIYFYIYCKKLFSFSKWLFEKMTNFLIKSLEIFNYVFSDMKQLYS